MTKKDESKVETPEIETPAFVPTQEMIDKYLAGLNEKQLVDLTKTADLKLTGIKVERKNKVESFFKSFAPSLEIFVHDHARGVLGDLDRKSINLSAGYVDNDIKGTLSLTLERVVPKKDTSGKAVTESSVLQAESELEFPDKESLDKAA